MGYTHFYSYYKMSEAEFRAITKDIVALRQAAFETLGVESDYDLDLDALSFQLNGKEGEAAEPYEFIAGDMRERRGERHHPDFFYCKTAYRSYDVIVAASLIAMKHHMTDGIRLSSDGRLEEEEWDKAFKLYHSVFPDRAAPMPLFRTAEEAAAEAAR